MRQSRLLVAFCVACAGAGGEVPDARPSQHVCSGSGGFDLNGRMAVLASLTVHINAQGIVDTDATASLLLAMDIDQTGEDVGVVAQLCTLQIPDIPVSGQDRPVHFEPGPTLLASLRPVTGVATLEGLDTCASFTSEPITMVIGARMSPPALGTLPEANGSGAYSECLPSTAGCYDAITTNCACDQEDDGHPGATLFASNVPAVPLEQVYVNLRTTFTLAGQVWSSDLILGEVDASLEQGILGCRKSGDVACSAGEIGLVKNLNPDITRSDAEPSTFRAVRVPPATSCADIVTMRDDLFPR
jgi:hypothetical protein